MKSIRKIFLLSILLSFCSILNARTREDVINDANEYANSSWLVHVNNILDLKTYHYDKQLSTWSISNSTDGIDDRAQAYYDFTNKKWLYSETGDRRWWPFFIGDNPHGEAYAWGGHGGRDEG